MTLAGEWATTGRITIFKAVRSDDEPDFKTQLSDLDAEIKELTREIDRQDSIQAEVLDVIAALSEKREAARARLNEIRDFTDHKN